MLEEIVGFVFSALLGLALVVAVALLARKEMVKHVKASEKREEDKKREKAGDAENRNASDGPNQG